MLVTPQVQGSGLKALGKGLFGGYKGFGTTSIDCFRAFYAAPLELDSGT